jgi:hypothetical protein
MKRRVVKRRNLELGLDFFLVSSFLFSFFLLKMHHEKYLYLLVSLLVFVPRRQKGLNKEATIPTHTGMCDPDVLAEYQQFKQFQLLRQAQMTNAQPLRAGSPHPSPLPATVTNSPTPSSPAAKRTKTVGQGPRGVMSRPVPAFSGDTHVIAYTKELKGRLPFDCAFTGLLCFVFPRKTLGKNSLGGTLCVMDLDGETIKVCLNNIESIGQVTALEKWTNNVVLIHRVSREDQGGKGMEVGPAFSVTKVKLAVDGDESWLIRSCPKVPRLKYPQLKVQTVLQSPSTFVTCAVMQCMEFVRQKEGVITVYNVRTSIRGGFAQTDLLYFNSTSNDRVQHPSYNVNLLAMTPGEYYVVWNVKVYNESLTCTTHTAVVPAVTYVDLDPKALLAPIMEVREGLPSVSLPVEDDVTTEFTKTGFDFTE